MDSILVLVKNLTTGGAEKQSVVLANALASRHNVHYVIYNGGNVHEKYINQMNNNKNIHVLRLNGNIFNKYIKLIKHIKKNKIEYAFSYLTAANLIIAICSLFVNIRVYIGLRNSRLPFLKLLSDRFVLNHLVYGAVVNCYSGRDEFVSKGFIKEKLHVIQNSFEINTTQQKLISKSDNCRVITVGRFVPQKDYDTAIKAIAIAKKHIPNIEFYIVGYGTLESHIRKLVNDYQLNNNIKIFINPSNVEELLKQSNIYLSTSLFEGTSNSIMEAMNAELPIIATNVGDNFCMIENNKNGYLVKTGDHDDICEKILYLYNNPQDILEFGLKSKEILIENFSINKFINCYEKLLNL